MYGFEITDPQATTLDGLGGTDPQDELALGALKSHGGGSALAGLLAILLGTMNSGGLGLRRHSRSGLGFAQSATASVPYSPGSGGVGGH